MCSWRRYRGSMMPGVSKKMNCVSSVETIPEMRVRVVWGLRVTAASFWPTRAFRSVDLPTFGRPSRPTNPARNPDVDSVALGSSCSSGIMSACYGLEEGKSLVSWKKHNTVDWCRLGQRGLGTLANSASLGLSLRPQTHHEWTHDGETHERA